MARDGRMGWDGIDDKGRVMGWQGTGRADGMGQGMHDGMARDGRMG